jgi:signal transduction histidine kinase
LAVDGILAATLALLCVLSAPYNLGGAGARAVDPLGYALMLLACAALVARRLQPVWSVLVAAVSVSVYLALSYPYGWVMVCLAIGVYSVARHRRTAESVVSALASLALLGVHLLTNEAALDGPVGLVPLFAWVAVPFTIGLARRLVLEAAAAARQERDRRLVDAERLRIAQEVHDILGHGLAAIQVQAAVALHLGPSAPAQAQVALEAISRSSAAALAELRSTLDQVGSGEVAAAQQAAIGLDRLPELVRRLEESGVTVEVETVGSRRPLPAPVDQAVYRIVQESLTNVLKHGAERQAEVRVGYEPDALSVTVASPHPAGSPIAEGFGITGMRRRVAELGGSFRIDVGEGRFAVSATLPTADVPSAPPAP